MPLTDLKIKHLKPETKTVRYSDGRGLYLEISPTGGKWWRFKYRFGGKEKRISLGVYPDINLKDARLRCEDAKRKIKEGIDPSLERQSQRACRTVSAENSFEAIAREWFSHREKEIAGNHSGRIFSRLERDVFPWIGSLPIEQITAPVVLSLLRRIVARGAVESAHRAKSSISQVMRYAITTGRAERDPCPDLKGALPSPRVQHFSAIIDPGKVGPFLNALDEYEGSFIVKCALRLAPLVFVRPGELRQAQWTEINFDRAEWRFFVSKTKIDHLVPLSTQAISILKEIRPLTGHGKYIFPSPRSLNRPLSDNGILSALRRMGFEKDEMSGHGFRAMARTLLAEELHIRPEIIEHQLAHKVPDALGAAYNRTRFIKERVVMMQDWADYLDKLKLDAPSREGLIRIPSGPDHEAISLED